MSGGDWLQRHQVAIYAAAVLVAVGAGVRVPGAAPVFGRLITPVLAALLYVTFLGVPFTRFRRAVTDARFMGAALGMNFLVVPAVVYALARILPPEPVLLVGVYLVLLTPCIDYVVPFTELAGGNAEQVTATTPALLLVQFLLLPVYLWLFMGGRIAEIVEVGPFVEAFAFLIALPLTLAWVTMVWADRTPTGRRWQDAMGWLPVPLMAATLLVVVASQLPRVQDSIGQVVTVVPVYVAFLLVMPALGRVAAGRLRLDVGEARALVFTSVTRNSLVVLPLALALPAGYELAPVVVVTQTLVELAGMVALVRVVPAWLLSDAPRPVSISGGVRRE